MTCYEHLKKNKGKCDKEVFRKLDEYFQKKKHDGRSNIKKDEKQQGIPSLSTFFVVFLYTCIPCINLFASVVASTTPHNYKSMELKK